MEPDRKMLIIAFLCQLVIKQLKRSDGGEDIDIFIIDRVLVDQKARGARWSKGIET